MPTKKKILESAAEEFCAKGYRGTTIRDICQRAMVNVASVNYHFSCKRTLYKNVVEYLYGELDHKSINILEIKTEEEWKQEILSWVQNLLVKITNASLHYKWINKIFFREMLDASEVFPEFFEKNFNPYFSSIEQLIRLGFPSDTDKKTVYIAIFSVISQCIFYEQNKIIVSKIFDDKFIIDKEEIKRISLFITNSLCSNLKFSK